MIDMLLIQWFVSKHGGKLKTQGHTSSHFPLNLFRQLHKRLYHFFFPFWKYTNGFLFDLITNGFNSSISHFFFIMQDIMYLNFRRKRIIIVICTTFQIFYTFTNQTWMHQVDPKYPRVGLITNAPRFTSFN